MSDATAATISRPALRYFGGKWRLATWLISNFPEHRCYVEPFGGGASVLLRKPRSKIEVYNDLAGSVVNFFRVARDRGPELRQALSLTPFASEEYYSCRGQDVGDDLERARRFFVRSWGGHQGTNGAGRNRGWRRTPDRAVALDFDAAIRGLVDITTRLRGVAIDATDWRQVLGTYDRADTLFYIDPPYWRPSRRRSEPSSGYGEHEFDRNDHVALCEAMVELKGRVVLSGYATPLYDELLQGWERREFRGRRLATSASEYVWINPA